MTKKNKSPTKLSSAQIKSFLLTKYKSNPNQTKENNLVKANLAIEAPLKILYTHIDSAEKTHPLTTLLRTPKNNKSLVAGFLFAEGYFKHPSEIYDLRYSKEKNIISVVSYKKIKIKNRLFITHGGCGSYSIDDLKQIYAHLKPVSSIQIPISIKQVVQKIEAQVKKIQLLFNETGGVHACVLFDKNAELLSSAEDIGRHNALDKAIGKLWLKNKLEKAKIAWVSGRMGFELVQKAINADIAVLISVGAPTTLAIELANQYGLCTIGFSKKNQFNCYSPTIKQKIFL